MRHCGNGHWMGSPDSESVQLQITLNCKKKTSTSSLRRERPLIKTTGWVPLKERGKLTERERQRENKSLIDVENVGKLLISTALLSPPRLPPFCYCFV